MPSLIKRNNVSMDSIIVHNAKYKIEAATDKYKSQNYPNLGIGARSISNRSRIYKSTFCCSATYLPPSSPEGIILLSSDSTNITIEITGKINKVVSFYITYTPSSGGTTKYATFSQPIGTLTDLNPNTNYTISVVSINPAGTSDAYVGTNTYYTTISPPTDLISTGATSTTIDISFNESVDTANNYTIFYTPTNGSTDNTTISGNTTTISGLTSGTLYTILAKANGDTGESSESNSITKYTTPSSPTSLVFSNISTTSMDIGFTAPSGTVTSYTITYTPAGGSANTTTVTTTSASLTGLTSDKQYTISIVATNDSGNSVALSGTTYTILLSPTNITLDSNTDNSLTISYTAPSSGTVTKYMVYYTPSDGSTTSIDNGTNTTLTISNLTENTSYTIYITAMNANTTSSNSASVTFTTDLIDVYTPTTFSSILDTEVYL
jgi:hypothetical protein